MCMGVVLSVYHVKIVWAWIGSVKAEILFCCEKNTLLNISPWENKIFIIDVCYFAYINIIGPLVYFKVTIKVRFAFNWLGCFPPHLYLGNWDIGLLDRKRVTLH